MQRARSSSRPRNDARSSLSPSPSPSPVRTSATSRSRPRARSPSRGRRRSSFHAPSPSLSRSRSHSRSRSRSSSISSSRSASRSPAPRRHRHRAKQVLEDTVEHPHGLFKNTAGLIAGIGLATFLAHKAWPKGILYGDEEEWASRPLNNKHQHQQQLRPPQPQRRASDPRSHQRSHSHHHHRRRSSHDAAPVVIERARSVRGRDGRDVVYYEEIVPLRKGEQRRPDLEARGFRMERRAPPYPEHSFPDERFYEPRSRAAEPMYR